MKTAAALLALAVPALAEGPGAGSSLYAGLEFGQFVGYKYRQEDFRHAWRNRAYLDYSTHFAYDERFRVDMGLGGFMWFNTFPKQRNTDRNNFDVKHVSLFISRAAGTYALGPAEKPWLKATAGLFPYKYNPDARNLGEYLFRSGAYPNFILGDFDFALARLLGVRLSAEPLPGLASDLILSSETDIWPHYDLNLSWLAAWDFRGVFELGGGVSFTNIVSMDEDKTSPRTLETQYLTDLRTDTVDIGGVPIPITRGDTGYYTFKSTKIMLRAAFRPQALLRASWLGPEDLKLYGEAALLGVRNYPRPLPDDTVQINSFFADRMERLPIMAGFNLPAFKLLDVLAVEVEWHGLKGPNSFEKRKEDQVPMPQSINLWETSHPQYYSGRDYRRDDWKWSVHARKTLLPGFDIVAQAARDHVRHDFDSPVQLDREEALTRPGHWWWALKLQFHD